MAVQLRRVGCVGSRTHRADVTPCPYVPRRDHGRRRSHASPRRQHRLVHAAAGRAAGLHRGADRPPRRDARRWIDDQPPRVPPRRRTGHDRAPRSWRRCCRAGRTRSRPGRLRSRSTASAASSSLPPGRRRRRAGRRASALHGVSETFRLLDRTIGPIVDGIPTRNGGAGALRPRARPSRVRRLARDRRHGARRAATSRVAELDQVLDDLGERGRAGTGKMRAVVAERRRDYVALRRATLEAAFLELVATHGLPEPARQVDLGGPLGWIGRVDFAWRDRTRRRRDRRRRVPRQLDRPRSRRATGPRARAPGWTVLRFGWNDVVHRPTSVVRILRTRARDRRPDDPTRGAARPRGAIRARFGGRDAASRRRRAWSGPSWWSSRG